VRWSEDRGERGRGEVCPWSLRQSHRPEGSRGDIYRFECPTATVIKQRPTDGMLRYRHRRRCCLNIAGARRATVLPMFDALKR